MPHINPVRKQEYGIWVYDYDGENVAEAKATKNYQNYGCLYDWTSAMDIDPKYLVGPWEGDSINRQGLCPPGWHLPSDKEYKILEKYLGMPESAINDTYRRPSNYFSGIYNSLPPIGSILKSSNGWLSDGSGKDSLGFTALPGGMRTENDRGYQIYENLGYTAYFWTSNLADSIIEIENGTKNAAWIRMLTGRPSRVININSLDRLSDVERKTGLSVRCLKNQTYEKPGSTKQISPINSQPMVIGEPATWHHPIIDTIIDKGIGAFTPIIIDNVLMAHGNDSCIHGYDSKYLQEKWKVQVSGKRTDPGFAFPNGDEVIYIIGNSVTSINYMTGDVGWKFNTNNRYTVGCADSMNIYLCGYGPRRKDQKDTLVCLEKRSGAIKWQQQINTTLMSFPNTNGQIILYNSKPAVGVNLIAFDCNNGNEKWQFSTKGPINLSDPIIFKEFCITNGGDSYIYVVDINSGNPIKRFFINSSLIFGDPIVHDSIIYIGAQNQSLYAFDLSSGTEKWRFQYTSPPMDGFNETSVIIDDFIISGTAVGTIYCLNKKSGQPVWKAKIDGAGYFHPIVNEKKLYLSTADGTLIRIDPYNYK
jgi:uncharacterized protein (TIGR02145 family)